MSRRVAPLFLLPARCSEKGLARVVEHLKAGRRILRDRLPKRLTVTPRKRQRLVKLGRPLGSTIRGRSPSSRTFARSTVLNILKEHSLGRGPKRGEGIWDDFARRHAQTMWVCDFFEKRVWTLRELVDVFVLFFIHIGTRRVFVSGMTAHPDRAWVAQQARNVAMHFGEQPVRPRYLLRDHDTKFVEEFDAILKAEGVEVKAVGPLAPDLNAHAERWVQSIKSECLDHFVVFGEAHLRHSVDCYVTYYNTDRPHQSLGNVPLSGQPPGPSREPPVEVACAERLGGLLRHYYRKAA
ncbi:MAG TPA: integrase core domain-containing protein [Gemmataceae bacterium]